MTDYEFETLLAEAARTPFQGWDFSWLGDRYSAEPLPWDYRSLVESATLTAASLLDMGTGGGEFLSTIQPLPALTVATEGYPPNWPVAKKQLGPLDATVVAVDQCPDNSQWEHNEGALPFGSASFDLVINRHEAYSPTEVARVLSPAGIFITQQVGSHDQTEFLEWFDRAPPDAPTWNLENAATQLEALDLEVTDASEAHPTSTFTDVGAVAYYLKAVPWRVPGFDIAGDHSHLARLHAAIQETRKPLRARSHRFWLTARKLPPPNEERSSPRRGP